MGWCSEGSHRPSPPAATCSARRPQTARARLVRPLEGKVACEQPRSPGTPRPCSAEQEESTEEKLRAHLERLWEYSSVPEWHRTLYTARYLQGGFSPEVLRREAKLLVAGTAPVQRAMRAVEAREELLTSLESLRLQHDDAELRTRRSARERLLELFLGLRMASVEAVEAISFWRRSVAPLPGQGPPAASAALATSADVNGWAPTGNGQATGSASVAGPGARGTCWPFGSDGEDYLWHLARNDSAVRAFEPVVELLHLRDPLLLHSGPASAAGAAATSSGKLRLPPLESSRRERFENARMLLWEEEIALEISSNKGGATAIRAPPCLGFGGHAVIVTSPTPHSHPQAHGAASAKCDYGHSPSKERPVLRVRASTAVPVARKSMVPAAPPGGILMQKRRTAKLNKLASMLIPHSPGFRTSVRNDDAIKRFFAQIGDQLRAQSRNRRQVSSGAYSGASSPRSGPSGQGTPRRMSVSSTSSRKASMMQNSRLSNTSSSSYRSGRRRQGSKMVPGALPNVMDLGEPAVDRARIELSFRHLAHDGLLHTDQLRAAVQRSGFSQPGEAELEEAYKGVTTFTTMNLDEFSSIVMAYEARQRLACLEIFRGGSTTGQLNTAQMTEVLRKLDLEPMPHVLAEVIAEVNEDQSGQVNFRDFYKLVVRLKERETFTRAEYEELLELFQKFDHSSTGEMDVRDLHHALLYLGFRACTDEVDQFVSEVDAEGIDLSEFLYCMRRVRESELTHVLACMEAADLDLSGTITVPELPALLEHLGYYCPDEHIIDEVFQDVKDRMEISENEELDLGAVWQFLRLFRMREGLSREMAAEVEEAFLRFAGQDADSAKNEVSKRDLPKVLHYLGYRTSFEEQLLLAAEVDIDNSGALCLGELRKLVRICGEERMRAIKESFDRFDIFGTGILSSTKARLALKNVPGLYSETPEAEEESLEQKFESGSRVTEREFMRIAIAHDEAVRQKLRESEGFSSDELASLKNRFQEFDDGRMGMVSSTDLVGLVISSSPSLASDPMLRPQLMDIIRKADATSSGTLGFPEFLQLMQSVREMIHREQFSRERQAMSRSGFTPAEVHQFRGIFLSWANKEQRLPRQVFQEMLTPLCPAGGRSAQLLSCIWRRHFFKKSDDGSSRSGTWSMGCNTGEEADFASFLLLMRDVLDANIGNVLHGGGRTTQLSLEARLSASNLRRCSLRTREGRRRRSVKKHPVDMSKWQSFMQSKAIS